MGAPVGWEGLDRIGGNRAMLRFLHASRGYMHPVLAGTSIYRSTEQLVPDRTAYQLKAS